ncbi:MAG: tyrosine-type recombinase/integrase [Ectothiorhodospiraceae bacterium]|nr:tyrosine-type recombinase/integrase [Ectothiorhodospiraceae bacterium]
MKISEATRQYLNAMNAMGRSPHTVKGAKSALKELNNFLYHLDVETIEYLNHDTLMHYREELAWRLTPKGTPLTSRSQSELLGHLRAFCRWLVDNDLLVGDPSVKIPNPKKTHPLPKAILEPREIQKILKQPDMSTATGYRDKVILDVLYSTAIRRAEVANIKLQDLDTDSGYLVIREGKGGKDRVVPLGESICQLIDTYLIGIRPDWINSHNVPYLFLNRFGQGVSPMAIWFVVNKYAKAAKLKKPVSPHTFRHSCATHMLHNGAPIRHIQEMLGMSHWRPHRCTRALRLMN